MAKRVKQHDFTIDIRFQVIETPVVNAVTNEVEVSYVHQNQAPGESIGLSLPDYQCPAIADVAIRRKAETKLVEAAFVDRLLTGDFYILEPSIGKNLRLLNFHYDDRPSHSSRVAYVAAVRRILLVAIEEAESKLAYPDWIDFEMEDSSGFLSRRLDALRQALAWVTSKEGKLKVDRFREKEPSLKVRALGYLLLLGVNRSLLREDELPAQYKAANKEFSDFVTEKLIPVEKLKKARAAGKRPEGTIYNYMITSDTESDLYIKKAEYYDEARDWVVKQWPRVGFEDLPPLSKVL